MRFGLLSPLEHPARTCHDTSRGTVSISCEHIEMPSHAPFRLELPIELTPELTPQNGVRQYPARRVTAQRLSRSLVADPVAALIMVPIIAKEGIEGLQGKACDEFSGQMT